MSQTSKMKKMLTMILAALMLSSVTACGGNSSDANPKETMGSQETEPAETEAYRYVADYLPEVQYDGYQYRIIDYEKWRNVVEEITGEMVDDAVYQRNSYVEETYNVKITGETYLFTDYSKVNTLMQTAGRAQSDDFDLATLVFKDGYYAVLQGYAPAASSFPVVDITKPWYNQSANQCTTIDGITLLAFTAFDPRPGGGGVGFNKDIITDLNLDDPYDLVDAGKWTNDAMYKMAEAAIADLDGDGKMTVEDRFGFISEIDRMTVLAYIGTGNLLVDIIDGIPVASVSEPLIDAFTKMANYMNTEGFWIDTFATYGTAESSRDAGRELFKQGKGLFIQTSTSNLTTMGDMESDYGLVPLPKWNEEQTRYYCSFDAQNIALPLSCSEDLSRVLIIKEALAAESLNTVHPAFYENAVKKRYVRDEKAVEMIELITNSVVNDLGQDPWWDIIRTPWMNMLSSKKTDFASAVQKNMPKSEKAIQELMDMIEILKNG